MKAIHHVRIGRDLYKEQLILIMVPKTDDWNHEAMTGVMQEIKLPMHDGLITYARIGYCIQNVRDG